MTKRISSRIDERKTGSQPKTMAGVLAGALMFAASVANDIEWPSVKYQSDPVSFFREVLGVEPWDKQIEILEAVRDHRRVSIRAGHKVSKSNSVAGLALWFYCSFEDARVVMSSVTDRQVNQILWYELRRMVIRAKRRIDGDLHELARSGFKSPDFREIVGFTAKEAEAVAGVSGKNLLYLLDEASGIPEAIFEAIEGNRAGGARVVLTGNPTRCEGWFYRSHTDKKDFWKTIHLSSEDSPNVRAGKEIIPGLALKEWVDEMRAEWGEDSALFQVRVKGNFARQEAMTVIPLYMVDEAEVRWDNSPVEGRLHVGVDVARFGDDDSVAAPRRANKILDIVAWNGLDELRLSAQIMQVVRHHRHPKEQKAVVKVDACGGIGIRVVGHLMAYHREIDVVPVNVAEKSHLPNEFPLLRDQLWFGIRSWIKEGGAIPTNAKLAAELVSPRFSYDLHQRRRVESKDEIRKRLKRSPDRADAVALAIYEPMAYKEDWDGKPEPTNHIWDGAPVDRVFDPYAGEDAFRSVWEALFFAQVANDVEARAA